MKNVLTLGKRHIALDENGYLANLDEWNREVAVALAQQAEIELTESHWELIDLVRLFFERYGVSPSMRPLVKFLKIELKDSSNASSLYLMQHFPGSPATLLAKISGLPRPDNCL